MAVPRNRHSNARKNSKRAHQGRQKVSLGTCSNCKKPKLPHRICASCGHYAGRSVFKNEEGQETA